MEIKIKKFIIAGGNSTLLVWGCPQYLKSLVIKKYLGNVEQIGFIRENELEMMGGELCINGIIAFASQFGRKGRLRASGVGGNIHFLNLNGTTSVTFSIPLVKKDNIVLLSGIGFLFAGNKMDVTEKIVKRLSVKYQMPAFGVAFYKNRILTPYIYVKRTKSFFRETACGSGSIAVHLVTGDNNIIQPTGEIIKVQSVGKKITVSARVEELDFINTV